MMTTITSPTVDPPTDDSAAPRFWTLPIGLATAVAVVGLLSFLDSVIPPLGIPITLVAIFVLLRAAGEPWADLGLRRPASWPKTLGLAILCAAGLQALSTLVVLPLLRAIGAPLPDLGRFAALEGNLPMLLTFLVVSWTTAGFGEEVIWRGFVMGRLARLFGGERRAWIVALVATSVIFGLLHLYQGITGVVLTGVAGLFLGLLYLAGGRNLWLPILTHALTDTSSFLVLYFGWADKLLGG